MSHGTLFLVALLSALSPASARAQGTCPTSLRPDIYAGAITDVYNAPAANGLDAFTVGVTACNLGDAAIDWWANTNQHPVAATNLYRYQVVSGAGRFEQIGMSWLKHGFGAAIESLCCPCRNPFNNLSAISCEACGHHSRAFNRG